MDFVVLGGQLWMDQENVREEGEPIPVKAVAPERDTMQAQRTVAHRGSRRCWGTEPEASCGKPVEAAVMHAPC